MRPGGSKACLTLASGCEVCKACGRVLATCHMHARCICMARMDANAYMHRWNRFRCRWMRSIADNVGFPPIFPRCFLPLIHVTWACFASPCCAVHLAKELCGSLWVPAFKFLLQSLFISSTSNVRSLALTVRDARSCRSRHPSRSEPATGNLYEQIQPHHDRRVFPDSGFSPRPWAPLLKIYPGCPGAVLPGGMIG